MNEIKCPKCNEIFKIDEAGYADIIKQVRNAEFDVELRKQEDLLKSDKENAVKLAEANTKSSMQKELSKRDNELAELRVKLSSLEGEKESAVKLAEETTKNSLKDELAKKESELLNFKSEKADEIANLRAKLLSAETEKKLAISEAVGVVEKEREQLRLELSQKELEKTSLKEKHEMEIKVREDEIKRINDMKARLSTKMVGETLEEHCKNEFNRVRAMSFPNAMFKKDNDSSSGSKGDFIFRENDADNNEIISIMFEMKNENDTTATKKKNEDFFKELDKDRREKNCEYAVLVSLLEADNELYNGGIVDVSYECPKMFVVRPQFFLPIIGLLRNASLNSLKFKAELALMRSQNVDVTNFESQLNDFRDAFGRNFRLASERFADAIKNIDNSIAQLQKTKENLLNSENNLRLANNKAEDLTVKKLTGSSPFRMGMI